MKFNQNPYSSPHLCGLEIFKSIDTAGSYEFDMFVVWKKLDGNTLWWDTDSGCSCPCPFDVSDHGHDLKSVTEDTFYSFDQALKNHMSISTEQYNDIRQAVKNHLKISI